MKDSHRFNLVYTKVREVLGEVAGTDPQRADVKIRHAGEVTREELDEIARLREIILESSAPDPISFTTT